MNKFIIVSALVIFPAIIKSQTVNSRGIYTNKKEFEELPIGWLNVLAFKASPKPFSKNGWNYPANQIAVIGKLGSWLQETYTPVGVLGEIKAALLYDEPSKYKGTRSYDFNEVEKDNRLALPNTYGVFAKFHYCLSKTKEHKFFPTPGSHCYCVLNIMANNVELITKQVVTLSSRDEYYCTMPNYTIGQKGNYDKQWISEMAMYRGFTNSANLKAYEHYLNPAGEVAYTVIMTEDGKPLPFEQVTVGQFISRLENQFPLLHQLALNGKLIYENYLENAKKGIQVLKDKLKNKLQEYVYFPDVNRQIDIIDLANIGSSDKLPVWLLTDKRTNSRDRWQNIVSENTNYPLLRLKKGVKEACATGGPQWIVFHLTDPIDHSYGGSVHLMDSYVSRFNYAYVYNYFFGKDKVIAPYKPLASGSTITKSGQPEPGAELSSTAQKKRADQSIVFFEDFSSVNEGATPAVWVTERDNAGDRPLVTTIKGEEAKWLRLKGNASPKNLVLPLTGDFELSYELLVHKGDVPWGTPGIDLEMQLSAKGGTKRYLINVSPGDMNRNDAAGWVILSTGGATACQIASYYSLPDFTGSKPVNKVKITIRKKGEGFLLMSNDNKVYECASGFLPESVLSKLNFYVNEKNVYYLSNVQIRRI